MVPYFGRSTVQNRPKTVLGTVLTNVPYRIIVHRTVTSLIRLNGLIFTACLCPPSQGHTSRDTHKGKAWFRLNWVYIYSLPSSPITGSHTAGHTKEGKAWFRLNWFIYSLPSSSIRGSHTTGHTQGQGQRIRHTATACETQSSLS